MTDDEAVWESAPLRAVPDYPVDALSGPLRNLVDSTPLPAALVGGAGLAALAAVCGPATLMVYADQEVWPILWIPLMGPTSAGKSPSLEYTFAPLYDLDDAAYAAYKDELDDWEREKGKRGSGGEKPVDPTLIVNDVTIEMLFRMLEDNPHRAQVHDELSAMIKAIGSYKKNGGADRDKWLELWTGRRRRYGRATGNIDLNVPRPVVSVCGTLQPDRADLLGDNDDGMRPRWFPHAVDQEIEGWLDRHFDPRRWRSAIRALYRNKAPRTWKLNGEALELWLAASKRWKAEARTGENEAAIAALHKADNQCARVALILAESLDALAGDDPGKGGLLPVAAMKMAIAITDYVMDVWRSMDSQEVFAPTIADEKTYKAVKKWADFAGRQTDRRVSTRVLQSRRVGGVRSAPHFELVLDAYEAHYPNHVFTEPTGHGGSDIVWVLAPEKEAASADTSVAKKASAAASGSRKVGRGR